MDGKPYAEDNSTKAVDFFLKKIRRIRGLLTWKDNGLVNKAPIKIQSQKKVKRVSDGIKNVKISTS